MTLDHDACYRIFLARDRRFDGRIFVGVRTTGIYCRPICPAPPPKQCNVSFYDSAAAACEAGFRPCLRCRPEVSPEFAAWKGSSNTVSRALRLIEGGALDHMTVDAFAERLGIGARQLRRLFVDHVGAPPTAFAQTRRVHMAKQLVQETDLPIVQVALAAGYRSLRRFNEAFSAMFGRPPASLRKVHAGEGAPADGHLTLHLSFAPPYDWAAMIRTLAARAAPGVEEVTADRYRRTIAFDGAQGTMSVEPAGQDRLRVDLAFPKLDALPDIIARLRALFDLAADPQTLIEHLGRAPDLAPLVAARPGLRVAGSWDGFELVVRSVFGERLTRPASPVLMAAFVQAFGEPLASPADGLTHLFPLAERLCDADLAALGMTWAQASAIGSYAGAMLQGPSPIKLYAPVEETVERLAALPGFDRELAAAIATRFAQPTDDVSGIDAGLLGSYEPWRPWRAYAAVHLMAASRLVPRGYADAA
ncbi:MAG: helix-turn-helix domain-containing protein [Rhizobiales bacterium]|nr:helix-turn-helix domain-containing protein [Hyphomicrobiales bacterium]